MDGVSRFLANPDVSLREEEYGALLFNADTDTLQIINPIGSIIWRFIKNHSRTRGEIVSHLRETCENVPEDKVEADVECFIADLEKNGFIGEVTDEK